MNKKDEDELAWWRKEFSCRIEPNSVKWVKPGQSLLGVRLEIKEVPNAG